MRSVTFLVAVLALLLPLGCGGNDGPTDASYATLVVNMTRLPSAPPNVAYSETLVAIGGDGRYSWSITVGSLPTGLTLNPPTGEIAGTPTVLETQNFTVEVTSGDGQTAQRALSITVPLVIQPSELCSDYSDSAVAAFEDATLEAAIRAALSVGPKDDLSCGLISGLTALDGFGFHQFGEFGGDVGIASLVGIQNLTSLTFLWIAGNPNLTDISELSGLTSLTFLEFTNDSITDIGPLSGLTSLTFLGLGANSITDIGPLSGLTSLTELDLNLNSITDIGPLNGLTSLTELDLSFNLITDIGPLSGLTSLLFLSLHYNSITDISVLSGLTSMTFLNLNHTPLIDIQPLMDNTGLGVGDTVSLVCTNVSLADLMALSAKGVFVQYFVPYGICP